MPKHVLSIKQYKVINISLLIIFFILWMWLLFNLNQLFKAVTPDIETIYEKLKYLAYFLILDIVILAVSLILWFSDTKKRNSKNLLIKAEKERIIKAQQLESEKMKKLLSNMSDLYNEAIESDRLKTEFFSNISHELKTPLSVILGAIQLIEHSFSSEPETKKSEKNFRTIRQNCYRLIRLINNILDFSKLDSGFLKISPTNCNIVYLIEEITQSVVNYAEQKGIILEFDTDYEEIITGVDVDKIERIILNLLSNSIKFTAPGGKINVYISSADKNIFISVKDTGVGIPLNMQDSIFDRFKQADNSLIKDYEGTGIGLSLVKSFVELHNGKISVKSDVDKGSEFIIELPINIVASNDINKIENNNFQNKIIDAINIEFSDIYSIAS